MSFWMELLLIMAPTEYQKVIGSQQKSRNIFCLSRPSASVEFYQKREALEQRKVSKEVFIDSFLRQERMLIKQKKFLVQT